MDEAASKLGISRNEMILKAISMTISLDKVFYKKLEAYSEKMKASMRAALLNRLLSAGHRILLNSDIGK